MWPCNLRLKRWSAPLFAHSSIFVQRTPEKSCLNDVSEVGTWRKAVVVAAIVLVVLTLLPIWDELAEELGVGLVTTF